MDRPTRRRLLAASGAAVAGCLDRPDSSAGGSGGNGGDDNGSSAGSDPPEEPDPEECPEYDDRVERAVCGDEGSDVVLEPDAESVGEGESIAFALENGGDTALRTNFYDWRIDKHVEGEWFRVAPMESPDPLMAVGPGESHAWTVTIDNGGLDRAEPVRSGGTDDLALWAVGGGQYAFRARGWFEDESHEEAIAFATTFEIDADALELAPSEAVEGIGREGDTVVAASDRGDPENDRRGAFVLERVDDHETPEPVIVEQLFRRPQLRDTIAVAIERDADRVRLEEYDGTRPGFGARSDRVFKFRGEHYRVSTDEMEE